MAKYNRRRRRPSGGTHPAWLGPRHPNGCLCAGDHCGQVDAAKATRRTTRIRSDDTRTFQVARSIGLRPRSRRR
jgi:hypothetical protein